MTMLIAWVLLVLAVAVFVAASTGDPIAWAREEWRRIRARTWAPGEFPSSTDTRIARMALKQRALAKRMRREGRHLLAGKPYVPVLTKPAEPERAPRADKVVPIRRSA